MRWWTLLLALVPLVRGQDGLGSEILGAEDMAVGESQRHEQFVPPPKGFLSPLASSPAFEDLGGFMEDHRRDRKIFGFTEEGPIPVRSLVDEVKPVRKLYKKSPVRVERMRTFVEDGVKLVPAFQGQVNLNFFPLQVKVKVKVVANEKKLSLLSQVLPAVVGQPRSGRKAVSALYLFPHFLGTSLSQTQSLGGVDGP